MRGRQEDSGKIPPAKELAGPSDTHGASVRSVWTTWISIIMRSARRPTGTSWAFTRRQRRRESGPSSQKRPITHFGGVEICGRGSWEHRAGAICRSPAHRRKWAPGFNGIAGWGRLIFSSPTRAATGWISLAQGRSRHPRNGLSNWSPPDMLRGQRELCRVQRNTVEPVANLTVCQSRWFLSQRDSISKPRGRLRRTLGKGTSPPRLPQGGLRTRHASA